ncbi:MAG: hypothetical protein R3F42_06725 [Pseudomonadota bacterium]
MAIHCFTSISFSYLAKARVLAWSLKRFHPDWVFTVCITDHAPEGFDFNLELEPFDRVLWTDALPVENLPGWLFGHDVVEACTAVKGPAMRQLAAQEDAEKIFYLDPDIAVFASLQPLVEMLDEAALLLTPHQLEPETRSMAIKDNERTALRLGVYNLGFVAVRNDVRGRAFLRWWNDRLLDYCYDEPEQGIFVDQKWCDLVPALFDGVRIVRDPGYNVASWNLSNRTVRITATGDILVNGSLLRFFHFTKLGPLGDLMTQRYAQGNTEVYELWAWYRRMVERFAAPQIPDGWWYYGHYDNGEAITKAQRVQYRLRPDLQQAFPDPFAAAQGGYFGWLHSRERA